MVCDPDSEFTGMISSSGKDTTVWRRRILKRACDERYTQFFRQCQMFNISSTFFGLFDVTNNNQQCKEKTKEILLLFLLNSIFKGQIFNIENKSNTILVLWEVASEASRNFSGTSEFGSQNPLFWVFFTALVNFPVRQVNSRFFPGYPGFPGWYTPCRYRALHLLFSSCIGSTGF